MCRDLICERHSYHEQILYRVVERRNDLDALARELVIRFQMTVK